MKIKLSSVDDVREFVRISNDFPNDVDLSSGRYVVDGKSIMGIFSLDLSSYIELTVRPQASQQMLEQLQPFLLAE